MPSVKGVAKTWSKLYPQFAAYLAGANYSKSIPNVPGIATVLGDFNQQLQALPTTDAKTILDRINRELQAILQRISNASGIDILPAARVAARRATARTRGGLLNRVRETGCRDPGIRGHQAAAGWLFLAPAIVLLGLFLVAADRDGALGQLLRLERQRRPVRPARPLRRPRELPAPAHAPGLDQSNFGTSLRNNFYYVLLVVPIQTAVALFLAVLVNRGIKAVGSFRTAFYFPSVTSSVAITILFLFLFSPTGVINELLSYVGVTGPSWLYDPRGLFHVILAQFGVDQPPASLANGMFLGVSYWDWLSGPSIAMCVFIVMAVFTTSGTFMLLFLAALQSIDDSVNEAAALDGATEWRKFRYITVPMIRPMIFTVVTLGLIGTWQIFDQIYVGTKGSPSNTTLTPAFLSFNTSFNGNEWGVGAAIAFILFAIIVFFTIVTRLVTRNPDRVPRRRRFGPTQPLGFPDASRIASAGRERGGAHRNDAHAEDASAVRRRREPGSRTASSSRSRSSSSSPS